MQAWATKHCDPIKEFEKRYVSNGFLTVDELDIVKDEVKGVVMNAVQYADESPDPPSSLAKELEYPTPIETNYNDCIPPPFADIVNKRTISSNQMQAIIEHLEMLRAKARIREINISEAVNLAIHEEMLRDPLTTVSLVCFKLSCKMNLFHLNVM